MRPKVKVEYPLGPERCTLSGYIANELFYDNNQDDFVRNRFFAGLGKKVGKSWSVDVYYCRQQDLHGREPDLDIVGISIGVRFDLAPAERRNQPTEK